MPDAALAGVTVVELAESLAAAYCGKLLADLGARVTVVEPPEGPPLRRRGASRGDASYSGLFAYLTLNKQRHTVTGGDPRVDEIIASADIAITDSGPAPSRFADVIKRAKSPRLITVDVSAFGKSGRYSSWKTTDFTAWAMGGYMYFMGEASREPLTTPGGQTEFHGGVHAALAALAALYEQRRSGFGQEVEVSNVEAVLSAHSWLSVAWSHSGTILGRTTHDFTRCRDGWVCFMRGVMYPSLFVMIERPELMDDPRWADRMGWVTHMPQIYEFVAEWCATRGRDEIVAAAQELRIACLPLNDARALSESPQLAARDWWIEVDDPELGRVRLPGAPYKLSETPNLAGGMAPEMGSVTVPARSSGTAPVRKPLEGLRVLELTSNWAGPVCGRHLGDLGAEVIKVESPTRPATRGIQWPRLDPQRQDYNRAGYFNQMNRNKRDVVLDIAVPAGRAAFLELIRRSDVFIENNSARVMPNLGLGYGVLSAVNPGLIMVSMSGSGASGPERDFVAYGSTIEASAGLAAVVGYDESQPYRTGFYYADPVAGAHGSVAILAALEHRRRTGRGQWIEVSLNEATAGFFAEALMEYQISGRVPERVGNRSSRDCPQGAYRCAGIDNWLAVTVQDTDEWRALCGVIGRDNLGGDASLATLEGRQMRAEEIDGAISAWAATREQYEATWELQRAGVPAAPVLANWQLLADPHLHERQFYVPIEHPVVGVYPFPSWPWRFSRTKPGIARAAPLFGEHNHEILRELGLSEDEIAAMYEAQVTSDAPVGL